MIAEKRSKTICSQRKNCGTQGIHVSECAVSLQQHPFCSIDQHHTISFLFYWYLVLGDLCRSPYQSLCLLQYMSLYIHGWKLYFHWSTEIQRDRKFNTMRLLAVLKTDVSTMIYDLNALIYYHTHTLLVLPVSVLHLFLSLALLYRLGSYVQKWASLMRTVWPVCPGIQMANALSPVAREASFTSVWVSYTANTLFFQCPLVGKVPPKLCWYELK